MSTIISKVRRELKSNIDEKTRESGERFFKEEVKILGVKTAVVGKIAREFYKQIKDKSKEEIFNLCEELWKSGCMEESFIACNWSHFIRKCYTPEDFIVFDNWVNNYVTNWASCDTLCNHSVGTFVEMYPQCVTDIKTWAKSENLWVRRASAVTFIVPAKTGKFLECVFEIADILLTDKEDLVQKGYGWMLKVASQAHQKEVFDYIMMKKAVMPRTALRYSIEKMPEDLREKAMR
jgi:3-methyladenine DNA glycosylase AlkD